MTLNRNLDYEAQRTAQAIVGDQAPEEMENRLRRALAILQEQGVYAAVLYLYAKESTCGAHIADKLLQLAQSVVAGDLSGDNMKRLQYVTDNVAGDLNKLLLVKQLWEQALIYARFACKV